MMKTEELMNGHKEHSPIKKTVIKLENTGFAKTLQDVSASKHKVKTEKLDEDEDMPLAMKFDRHKVDIKEEKNGRDKHNDQEDDDDDDDDEPLVMKKKKLETGERSTKKEKSSHLSKKTSKTKKMDSESEDEKPKIKKKSSSTSKNGQTKSPTKKVKQEEVDTTWEWWKDSGASEGIKWRTLEHNGPMFAPPYVRLPKTVVFRYDGKPMELSDRAEEAATFFAKMLEHDYTTRDLFRENFFKDWRKCMTEKEKEKITKFEKCDFEAMNAYFKEQTEIRKNKSKEEKLELKRLNEEDQKKYGFAIIDGHKQKIGNFKIEPPGLFRGRGDHPKQGRIKARIMPEDVTINCSSNVKIPAPKGHHWKATRSENTVTWLASWTENIAGSIKYVMLNASSKLKGEKDWQKYEVARRLHKYIDEIRRNYYSDLKSNDMATRQRAVAMYFIDRLALRAGNEKDEDTADTVGCCSLRVEHITLHDNFNGQENVIEFDFLGKDSIRYNNTVAVDKQVYKSVKIFTKDKEPGDDLFDRLDTTKLNNHLRSLMDGLSAKVFRTYNASKTLQEQLDKLTRTNLSEHEMLSVYNAANKQVAILCNHQKSVSKNFDQQMQTMKEKIKTKKKEVKLAKREYKAAHEDAKRNKSSSNKLTEEKKKKAYNRLKEQLDKLEKTAIDKDENKNVALGTSKLNYSDPRITVAWCKKYNYNIKKEKSTDCDSALIPLLCVHG